MVPLAASSDGDYEWIFWLLAGSVCLGFVIGAVIMAIVVYRYKRMSPDEQAAYRERDQRRFAKLLDVNAVVMKYVMLAVLPAFGIAIIVAVIAKAA